MRPTSTTTKLMLDRRVRRAIWELVTVAGGRYSRQFGIDVDAGEAEVERWFLAATLLGACPSESIAHKTFAALQDEGVIRVAQIRRVPWERFVSLLEKGGCGEHDVVLARLLEELSDVIGESYEGEVAELGRHFVTYPTLRAALCELPAWGDPNIDVFLRELRGVWVGATPPIDQQAERAARRLGLLRPGKRTVCTLDALADAYQVDLRDLEVALVRLASNFEVSPACVDEFDLVA
jgi:hypothetical protein